MVHYSQLGRQFKEPRVFSHSNNKNFHIREFFNRLVQCASEIQSVPQQNDMSQFDQLRTCGEAVQMQKMYKRHNINTQLE